MSTDPYQKPSSPPPIPPAPQEKRLGDDPGMRMLMPVGISGWAIAAGYLGLVSLILIPAPFALATGIYAVIDIRRSKSGNRPKYGMGRAIFGIVMGVLFTPVLVTMALRLSQIG